MKALDTFLAEQNLDQVEITPEDYQAMQRALNELANAPSFGGFGGPANFIHPELFDLYLNEIQQQESQNSERMNLIEWLILLWILKQWQESNNNLKPDPEPDAQNEFSLDYGDSLDRISAALFTGENDQPQPPKPNRSPRVGR
jgi:hypothetical protein